VGQGQEVSVRVPSRARLLIFISKVRAPGQVLEYVDSRKFGPVLLLQRIYVPRDHLLHALLTKVRYEVVSARGVWHILRLYHRCIMFSADAEAIAEHVGSLMRYIEKRHACGRPLDPPNLIRAVRLRALGVRGDLTDVGLIRKALQEFGKSRRRPLSFLVSDPRTMKSRIGLVGPSLSISNTRCRLLGGSASPFRFSWLLRDTPTQHLCKRMTFDACAALVKAALPSELPQGIWDEVFDHLRRLHGGQVSGVALPRLQ